MTEKEIIEFLEKKGFREVTEEDKKADWYKGAFEWPACFKMKAPQRKAVARKKHTEKKPTKVLHKKAV